MSALPSCPCGGMVVNVTEVSDDANHAWCLNCDSRWTAPITPAIAIANHLTANGFPAEAADPPAWVPEDGLQSRAPI